MSAMAMIDLTLHRIQRLAALLPVYTRPTCHIAGTNGKGSVSRLLSSILSASQPPLKVGRFNSPHLISIHDSIVINDKPVAADLYSAIRNEIELVDRRHDIGASSFKILTLTALVAFERSGVDVVVAEVGMGGRLDATNVIPDDCILVSALTSVDLDHQAFLGSTISAIAREKAGIARNGKPFVIGRQKHHEVDEVVLNAVAERGGHVERVSSVVEGVGPKSYLALPPTSNIRLPAPPRLRIAMPCFSEAVDTTLPLYGEHQRDNTAIATTIISTLLSRHPSLGDSTINLRERITPETVAQGIRNATWPGRLSFHQVCITDQSTSPPTKPLTVLIDGAHNPASATALAAFISELLIGPKDASARHATTSSISLTFVLGLSDSPPKTPVDTLTPLLTLSYAPESPVTTNIAVVRFSPPDGMPWVKSVAPSELRRAVLGILPDANVWEAREDEDTGPGALLRALKWAASQQEEQLVVVTGSLYLVADFYRLLRDGRLSSL